MNVHVPARDVCSDDSNLIEIDEACIRAARHASPITAVETVAICQAGGRTLAENIGATLPMPAFDQSAMDGYAVALGGEMMPTATRVRVVGRVAAGDTASSLSAGQAARIFTGAPLPPGADAVLMQEHGWRDNNDLVLHRMLRPGDNIRVRGEDIEEGDHLLSPGTRLDARHIALLAAQGRPSVTVHRRPRVGVLSTGNELRQPGSAFADATIYDSNRPMLMALAAQAGLDVVDGGCWVPDDPSIMAEALRDLSRCSDFIVTTGGASVGEEDHSAAAVMRAGGRCQTLRIALKPGKPAVVGRIANAVYLGLPGNPVSALVSWLILGGCVVATLQGRPYRRRPGYPFPVASRFERRAGRTEFAPACIVATEAGPALEILGRGGSARLRPLVEADGLVEIQALHAPVEPGATVLFYPFRDGFAV